MAVGYRSSSSSGASDSFAASRNVPVPTGAAAGDIAILVLEQWESANPTVTWPTGFTQCVNMVSGSQKLKAAWKRLTGADTGNYTITWTGSQWNQGQCILITGAVTTGDPIGANVNTASGSTSTVPTTTLTVADAAGFVHLVANENSATKTPPTSFTEVQDANYLSINYRMPGAAGTYSASGGTLSAATLALAALLAISPDTGGSPSEVTLTPATVTLAAVTLAPSVPASTVTIAPAAVTVAAVAVTPAAQPVTVTLTPAVLTLSGVALGTGSGPSTVTLTPATVTLTGQALSPASGPTSVTLTPAAVTISAVAVVATVGVTLTPAVVTLTAQPLTPGSGPTTVTLTPAVLNLTAVSLGAGGVSTVTITPATLTLTAQTLSPSVPASTVTLTPAPLTITARVLTPAPTVTLTPVVLAITARPVTATPGLVTISLTSAAVALTALTLVVYSGEPVTNPVAGAGTTPRGPTARAGTTNRGPVARAGSG